MTDEQMAVLQKFGFREEDGQLKHFKLGIVRQKEVFAGFASTEELQEYARQILRSQCLWKRQE
ncbi:hypothetical protein ACFSO0_13850 [Brevibacillus sp. GCM10020057]|uniref:hypothetical protein n=1 Tax=Brevibacillus sp. GCM10020057 TaxID=3317327 RepID=UPI00362B25D2